MTDRRTDGRTDGGDCNIPHAFLKKRWYNQCIFQGACHKKSLFFIFTHKSLVQLSQLLSCLLSVKFFISDNSS